MNPVRKIFSGDFRQQQLFIVLLGVLFFIPFLGRVHLFDWDEINFAESAREMIVTGNYTRVQINYEPFWEKPPLFFWLQAASMHLFGINEFAARFPNALCGIITLLVFFRIGKRLKDARFGMLWALLYFGSFLPHMYFKTGIIDPFFNLFIFLGIYFLFLTVRQDRDQHKKNPIRAESFLAGLFTGLAILTKGPVGLLLVMLTFLVFWAFRKFRRVSTWQNVAVFAVTTALVSSVWFGLETIKNGPWFLVEFIQYQIRLFATSDAGHQQPFYYHFVVVLLGCFPMSVFAIRPLFRNGRENDEASALFRKWMICLFWVVMILFTIVRTKIVHYSSMAYFPVSFLAASYLYTLLRENKRPAGWILIFNLVVGTVFSILLIAVPVLLMQKEWLMPFLKGEFAIASMNVDAPLMGWEHLIGIFYLLVVLLSFTWLRRQRIEKAIFMLCISTGITLMLFNAFVVPKIEAYSQRPAIDFYKSMQGKDVYVVAAYRSYAHYFYSRQPEHKNENSRDFRWLAEGDIDKPVYFVARIDRTDKLRQYPDIKKIGQKGGFVFYLREP